MKCCGGDAPEKKTGWRKYLDNPWVMVLVAATLLWVGRHFDSTPLRAEHQFLTTTEKTRGDVFDNAVLFVLTHRHAGAAAVILNRPEKESAGAGASGHDFDGGPLEKDKIIALQSLDVTFKDTAPLKNTDIGALIGKKAVQELQSAAKKPAWYHIYHGYAGWGPYQLESEIKKGEWEVVEYDNDVLTKTPVEKLRDAAGKLPLLHGH